MDDDYSLKRALALLQQGNEPPPDAASWAREKARIQLWSKQREICQSVQDNRKTAVRSCHGIGKSFSAAVIADWWVDTHPVDDVLVVTTAPSNDQVRGILWEEMRKLHRKASLPGDMQLSNNWVIGRTLVGVGRKPHDYNQDTFQGYHRKYLLVILDEAAGIPDWIWEAADNITTGVHCRILAIGNPTDPSSVFKRVCDPASGWNVIHVSAFDSPNFTGEEVSDEVREQLVGPAYVEEKRLLHGEDSPVWKARVLGEFPDSDESGVIPYSWVDAAQNRYKDWKHAGMPAQKGRKLIACDVARFGEDKTVIVKRKGPVCYGMEVYAKQDTEVTADKVANRTDQYNDVAAIDANGIGAGVVDKLKRKGYRVKAFNAQARTNATDRTGEWGFATLRSAAMWNLRELLDPANGEEIAFPDDDDLAADLVAPKWSEAIGGKIQVESKDDIKKRTRRSTDRGDAIMIAFWYPSGAYDETDEGAVPWTDKNVDGGAVKWSSESSSITDHFALVGDGETEDGYW